MNETPHGSSKLIAIASVLAVLLVMVVALFILRDHMREQIAASGQEQSRMVEKLATELQAVKSSLESLASTTQPTSESLTAFDAKLTQLSTTLDTMNTRLEALEKKPAEVKAEPLPVVVTPGAPSPSIPTAQGPASQAFTNLALMALSGKPYAPELDAWEKATSPDATTVSTLRSFAQSGIPSETEVIRELRRTLDTLKAQPATVDDVSMVGKINTHLAGLVSIKKSGTDKTDAYAALRTELEKADIARLIETAERLDEPSRAPLEAWLKTAKTRVATLAILANTHTESRP